MIVIEAPDLIATGSVFANGGGGGAGNSDNEPGDLPSSLSLRHRAATTTPAVAMAVMVRLDPRSTAAMAATALPVVAAVAAEPA